MSLMQSLVLGILQGLTEFLPVSSSGHLVVLKHLFGIEASQLFDIILHLGTLSAVVLMFWKPIVNIIGAIIRWISRKTTEQDKDYLPMVIPAIIATAVTAGIGFAVAKTHIELTPRMVSVLWIVTGLLLIGVSFFKGDRTYKTMQIQHGLVVGIAQGLGTLPGISRSGITIAGGLACGLQREYAGEFAFLLSIPAIVGAFVLEFNDIGSMTAAVSLPAILIGFAASFIVGIAALKILMPIVKKGQLYWFACYLIPAGILGLIFL